jgi:hypothetical protein
VKFARYWANAASKAKLPDGAEVTLNTWGCSDEGQAIAQAEAESRLQRMRERVAQKGFEGLQQRYGYDDRAMREPVLEQLPGGAISRNSYGCEVLNTARVMFVDIDLPEVKQPGALWRLLGAPPAPDPAEAALAAVEAWLARNPDWGFRAYRTKAGLRLLATHAPVEPAASLEVMAQLGADPLYVRLCKMQQSFRARLTPKPWRCEFRAPDVRWPFENEKLAQRFEGWREEYLRKSKGYAVCSFIRALGSAQVHAEAADIVRVHDGRAVGSGPLA